MAVPIRCRTLIVLSACAALVTLFPAAPAAADGQLPFGQGAVPADVRPLMQRPIGVSFISTHLTETLGVGDFALVLGGQPLPPGAVSLASVTHATHINGVNLDAWLLPFVNVHGMVGHVSGTADDINPAVMPGLLPPGVTIPTSQQYSGTTYGAGVTLAAGYRRMFASYDITYTSSTVDLLETRVGALAQSIRAGVKLAGGASRMAVYAGAFHESIRGTLGGTGLIPNVNPEFSMRVAPKGPWNMLVGANLELTPRFVVTAEAGLGDRKQFLISPGVRF